MNISNTVQKLGKVIGHIRIKLQIRYLF